MLIALAEEGHFARAAERLHMSPSALSRGIAALEATLGARLFDRTSRRVTLSEAGRVYLPWAQKITADLAAARKAAQMAMQGLSGSVAIGYMDLAIASFLPGLIAGFRQRHPQIDVQLVYGWADKQKQDLGTGAIDLGFILGRFPARGVANLEVAAQRLVAILPKGHPLAAKAEIGIADLAGESFVFGSKTEWHSLRAATESLCAAHGFLPSIVQEAPTRDGIFGFVAAGLGVSIYTDVAYRVPRPEIAILPIRDAVDPLRITAIWQQSGATPATKTLVAFLKDALPLTEGSGRH